MNIKKQLKKALEPLKIPVNQSTYIGKKVPYIVFQVYLEQGELFADDEELVTGYYIHLDLFGKENMEELSEKIKKLMKEAGFVRQASWDGQFEQDTKLYHKIFRFTKEKDIA